MNNYLLYKDILDYKNKSVEKDDFSPIIPHYTKDNILIHQSQKGSAGNNTLDEYFEENGILSSNWKEYSYRREQHRFSSDIFEAFQDKNVLVAEAGPGLGKTIVAKQIGKIYAKMGFLSKIEVKKYFFSKKMSFLY